MAKKRATKARRGTRRVGDVKPGTVVVAPLPSWVVTPVRPTPVRPAPSPGLPSVPVPVVPPSAIVPVAPPQGARARAEVLVADAQKLGAEASSAFYRLGLVLRDLARPEHFGALGFKTFDELLEVRDITSRAMAYRLMTVVDSFERGVAEKLGVEKSYAVVRYAAIASPGKSAVDVLRLNPVIRVRGKAADLLTASTRHIFDAIDELRQTSPAPVAYVKRVQKATRGISQRLERRDIRTARVRSVQRGSRVLVRVELDGSEAEKFLAMLRG